ncbi:unnamed protein product [Dibothriocephalus latus]|uniref:Uncharacterized protein n=1 Tax=Dibothriocephalus latus TaxID=60516 RepID=A0A3P7MG62_DIBLA|nr:unnamed protein product [Dibothriocephalus latus]
MGGLRPEGSRAHGPTESALILADFNPGYLSPDIVDVHLSVPSSQLVFYGALLRQFIHVKASFFFPHLVTNLEGLAYTALSIIR